MRVALRVDATGRIGGGHAMRCLTLADALSKGGAGVQFVSRAMPEDLAARIRAAGHRLVRIAEAGEFERQGEDWHQPPLDEQEQEQDARAGANALGDPVDWLVVDHYLLGAPWEKAARAAATNLLVIDDLANRAHDCDILVDQTLGRLSADYRQLVPERARILCGSQFAMLRPEFARERPAALRRRQQPNKVERILVSLGTTDLHGMTAPVVEHVSAVAPDCAVDVVLGPEASSLEEVQRLAGRNPTITVQVGTSNMAALMREADVAIGAAGTTSWERCCLGLPSLLFILAENQRETAERLAAEQAALVVKDIAALPESLSLLLSDAELRQTMTASAAAAVDGRGVDRIADVMIGRSSAARRSQLALRPAEERDSELLWLWRNDPLMRAMAKTHDPIAWRDHSRWFSRALRDPDVELLVAELDGKPEAMVRFDIRENEALVSINVSPESRGRHIGGTALEEACDHFRQARPEAALVAEIHRANTPSRKIFSAAGFTEIVGDDQLYGRFVREPLRADRGRAWSQT